jgi:hypothetical protein
MQDHPVWHSYFRMNPSCKIDDENNKSWNKIRYKNDSVLWYSFTSPSHVLFLGNLTLLIVLQLHGGYLTLSLPLATMTDESREGGSLHSSSQCSIISLPVPALIAEGPPVEPSSRPSVPCNTVPCNYRYIQWAYARHSIYRNHQQISIPP